MKKSGIGIYNLVVDLLYTVEEGVNYLFFQIDELRFEEAVVMLLDISTALDSINSIKEFHFLENEILYLKKSILFELDAIDKRDFFSTSQILKNQLIPNFLTLRKKLEDNIQF